MTDTTPIGVARIVRAAADDGTARDVREEQLRGETPSAVPRTPEFAELGLAPPSAPAVRWERVETGGLRVKRA